MTTSKFSCEICSDCGAFKQANSIVNNNGYHITSKSSDDNLKKPRENRGKEIIADLPLLRLRGGGISSCLLPPFIPPCHFIQGMPAGYTNMPFCHFPDIQQNYHPCFNSNVYQCFVVPSCLLQCPPLNHYGNSPTIVLSLPDNFLAALGVSQENKNVTAVQIEQSVQPAAALSISPEGAPVQGHTSAAPKAPSGGFPQSAPPCLPKPSYIGQGPPAQFSSSQQGQVQPCSPQQVPGQYQSTSGSKPAPPGYLAALIGQRPIPGSPVFKSLCTSDSDVPAQPRSPHQAPQIQSGFPQQVQPYSPQKFPLQNSSSAHPKVASPGFPQNAPARLRVPQQAAPSADTGNKSVAKSHEFKSPYTSESSSPRQIPVQQFSPQQRQQVQPYHSPRTSPQYSSSQQMQQVQPHPVQNIRAQHGSPQRVPVQRSPCAVTGKPCSAKQKSQRSGTNEYFTLGCSSLGDVSPVGASRLGMEPGSLNDDELIQFQALKNYAQQ